MMLGLLPSLKSPRRTSRMGTLAAFAAILAMPVPAFAAVALVKNVGAAANETSGTTIVVTVPAAGVAAGDTLIVTFAMDPASGTVSCADTKGNAYTKDADVTNGSGTAGVRTGVFPAPVTIALVS